VDDCLKASPENRNPPFPYYRRRRARGIVVGTVRKVMFTIRHRAVNGRCWRFTSNDRKWGRFM